MICPSIVPRITGNSPFERQKFPCVVKPRQHCCKRTVFIRPSFAIIVSLCYDGNIFSASSLLATAHPLLVNACYRGCGPLPGIARAPAPSLALECRDAPVRDCRPCQWRVCVIAIRLDPLCAGPGLALLPQVRDAARLGQLCHRNPGSRPEKGAAIRQDIRCNPGTGLLLRRPPSAGTACSNNLSGES